MNSFKFEVQGDQSGCAAAVLPASSYRSNYHRSQFSAVLPPSCVSLMAYPPDVYIEDVPRPLLASKSTFSSGYRAFQARLHLCFDWNNCAASTPPTQSLVARKSFVSSHRRSLGSSLLPHNKAQWTRLSAMPSPPNLSADHSVVSFFKWVRV